MRDRVLGPYRGYYVAVAALLTGELGDAYRGWGKVFDRLPASTLDPGALLDAHSENTFRRMEDALDDAEDQLFRIVDRLPTRDAETVPGGLECLAYVSRATASLDRDQLAHLLRRARERNREHGITGMLLYVDETFIQYFEGPAHHVQLVYRIIRKDPLHTGLVKFIEQPAIERVFSDWSMAFEMPGSQLWLPGEINRPELRRGLGTRAVHALLAAFLDRRSVR